MINPFLIGNKVYLRALQESDAEGSYSQWINDREVTKYLESRFFPNSVEDIKEYIRKNMDSDRALMLGIIEKASDRHIGNIKLDTINWIHGTANIGILIGEKDCYGKGYATEAIKLVIEHAFNRLNLRKISLGVIAENIAAVKVYEKIGFKVEGVKKEENFHDGHYCDVILMSIFKKNMI